MNTMFIAFKQTCGGCPESYDVYFNDILIGDCRLRNGYFRVDNSSGITIFATDVHSDGVFDLEERKKYLRIASDKLMHHHLSHKY